MKPVSALLELEEIITGKKIKTVFQPIISMKTGEILGYEALSRGPEGSLLKNPLKLFATAKEHGMLFELEKICRENALKEARKLENKHKIFINIDPYVIYDDNFKGGVTRDFLKKLNLDQKDIVIELTEKTFIDDFSGFEKALSHYKDQGYHIAIDDTGAGYSGLQSIVSISYNYIKIDRSLIENIDKDPVKKALLEAFVKFAQKIDSRVIAEGIETREEIDVLLELGVDYGQGYIIARPSEEFQYKFEIVNYIMDKNNLNKQRRSRAGIGELALRDITVTTETPTGMVVKLFKKNDNLQSIVVIDGQKPVGLIMRDKLYSRLGTRYGYAVFMERPVRLIMDKEPMVVEKTVSIDQVAEVAMERELSNIYDCIVVISEGNYYGSVSIRSLLQRFAKMQVEAARQLNPLTNLPGNPVIEREISTRLKNGDIISVLYIDLDNFKVYNDQYGFKKGDLVLKFTAEILSEAVTSISIAIVSNENKKIDNHLQVSDLAAGLKKYAKEQSGSIFVKDRRED